MIPHQPEQSRCKLPEVLEEIGRSMNDFITEDLDPDFFIRARLKLELADAGQVICTYHSSQQFDRDKVLDDLREWFDNYCESNEESDLYMIFLKAYRQLRIIKGGEQG